MKLLTTWTTYKKTKRDGEKRREKIEYKISARTKKRYAITITDFCKKVKKRDFNKR